MAMAKPINSLQFIFLNHLSSHEKIFIKVTPSQCSVCIRSLIVSAALWFRLNGRHELLLKVGKNLITFCTFRVASSHGMAAACPLMWHHDGISSDIKWCLGLCCCHGHRMTRLWRSLSWWCGPSHGNSSCAPRTEQQHVMGNVFKEAIKLKICPVSRCRSFT